MKKKNLFLATVLAVGNKLYTLAVMIALTAIITACSSSDTGEVNFCEFPKTVTLEGKTIILPDDECRVFGMADVVDDGYVYFSYDNPFALSASDKDFAHFNDFARKGQAPGEVSGVSPLFAVNPSNSCFTVYDPYLMKMYETSFDSNLALKELISFPDEYKRYSPTQVVKLKNGSYVGARGDFNYGLVSFNPDSSAVAEWPLGANFDLNAPVSDEVSMRAISYNLHRRIIAEIYGTLPFVILHDENGDIVGKYNYSGYSQHTAPDNNIADCFMDLELSDSYVWLLFGDPDESDESRVFTLDYEGNPIAEFIISPTYSIAVDEQKRRLISINPDTEDGNITIYELPDFLW